jgi:hypothetical protein
MDAASDPNVTLSSFIADPTPEQHIPKALALLRTLVALQTHRSKLSSRKCGRAPLAAPFLKCTAQLERLVRQLPVLVRTWPSLHQQNRNVGTWQHLAM